MRTACPSPNAATTPSCATRDGRRTWTRHLAASALVALVASGCAEDRSSRDAQRPNGAAPTSEEPAPARDRDTATTTTTPLVPTSEADQNLTERADQVVDRSAAQLALTEQQLDCLRNRLASVPGLLDEIGDAPEPDTPGFTALARAGEWCVVAIDLAPTFVEAITPSLTEAPTDAQRSCLASALADLGAEARQSIVGAGLDPTGADAQAGRDALDDLLATCDLARRR